MPELSFLLVRVDTPVRLSFMFAEKGVKVLAFSEDGDIYIVTSVPIVGIASCNCKQWHSPPGQIDTDKQLSIAAERQEDYK